MFKLLFSKINYMLIIIIIIIIIIIVIYKLNISQSKPRSVYHAQSEPHQHLEDQRHLAQHTNDTDVA